ncbi:MerR HTH family regulatory protein [Micrococcales bacterium KH10]|nr:MerR HTH family regulatory protein [Micrococcales bacterium KH10]
MAESLGRADFRNDRLDAALNRIRPEGGADARSGARAIDKDDHREAERWPRGISRRATMRISDVLAALRVEFPAVSHSKLRFLEEQGLVEPVRTPSGYRQYSPADVERLRFVLTEQRDRYLPLKVIKEKLAELDAGVAGRDQPLIPHLVSRDGETAQVAVSMEVSSVAERTGVPVDLINDLVSQGIVTLDESDRLSPWDEDVVKLCASLSEHGIDARHLRIMRSGAMRQADVIGQSVRTVGRAASPSAQAQRAAIAAELAEVCGQLHLSWLRQGVAETQ